jgi:heterotetrameric sarcosine oxidase gamma subunit
MQIKSEPTRLSPLHNQYQILEASLDSRAGWSIPEVYTNLEEETAALQERAGLVDISAKGKLTLKGVKADGIITARFGRLPTDQGDLIEDIAGQILVAKLTPDEFLILTPPGGEIELAAALETENAPHYAFVSVIDQTSGLVGLLISGPKSSGVMSKLCALDFNPTSFSDLHVAQSSFAKVRTTIIRHDRGDIPAFELYADRSYTDYLWTTILDAGKEFDIKPAGWKAVGL